MIAGLVIGAVRKIIRQVILADNNIDGFIHVCRQMMHIQRYNAVEIREMIDKLMGTSGCNRLAQEIQDSVCTNRGVQLLMIYRLNGKVQVQERVAFGCRSGRNLQHIDTALSEHTVIIHEWNVIPSDGNVFDQCRILIHVHLNMDNCTVTTLLILKHNFVISRIPVFSAVIDKRSLGLTHVHHHRIIHKLGIQVNLQGMIIHTTIRIRVEISIYC